MTPAFLLVRSVHSWELTALQICILDRHEKGPVTLLTGVFSLSQRTEFGRECSKTPVLFGTLYGMISVPLIRTQLLKDLPAVFLSVHFFPVFMSWPWSWRRKQSPIPMKLIESYLPFPFPGCSWAHIGCPVWSHQYTHTCLQTQEKEVRTPLGCSSSVPRSHHPGIVSSGTY